MILNEILYHFYRKKRVINLLMYRLESLKRILFSDLIKKKTAHAKTRLNSECT